MGTADLQVSFMQEKNPDSNLFWEMAGGKSGL